MMQRIPALALLFDSFAQQFRVIVDAIVTG
jgi:hypothetical protein